MDNCRVQSQGSAAWDEVFDNRLRVGSWDRAEQKELHYWEAGTIENRNGPFHNVRRLLLWGLETVAPLDWALGKCVRALFVVL